MKKYEEKNRHLPQSWELFFKNQFTMDLDNAKEQWRDEIRMELANKLAAEIRSFMNEKLAN